MQQTDVSSIHLNQSGLGYVGRIRVKGLVISCTSTGGTVNVWDSRSAPVAGTYIRSGTTVSVTSVGHGLSTGSRIGITFGAGATGGTATNGNYTVTITGANTFDVTDINSGTITGPGACNFVSSSLTNPSPQWHASFDTGAAAGTTAVTIPGEGILIENALYLTMTATHITSVTAFYG
jgi:hypothetical protein